MRLGLITTIFMGPFGFFGSIFAAIMAFFTSKKNVSAAYAEKILKKREESRDPAVLLAKLNYKKTERLADKMDILSYKEILFSTDEFAKINLIGMLSFNPSKENVSLIRSSLEDKDETVRILAATSLQKMDASFVIEILELRELEATLANSFNDGAKNYYLGLAEVYDDYLYTGLIAKENEEFYISAMLSCYKKAFEVGGDENSMRKYIRALIRFDRLDLAQKLCLEYIARYKLDDSLMFWTAEIAFKKRDIAALREILREINKDGLEFEPYKKSLRWWLYEG